MRPPATLTAQTSDTIRRARGLAQRGDFKGAAAEGERALAKGGDTITLSAMTGMFRARAGDPTGAVPFLRVAQAGRPNDLQIATNLVTALLESGDVAAAYAACPADFAVRDSTLLRIHAHLAQVTEDFPSAVAAYRKIVALDANDWEAWNNFGNALAGAHEHDESVEALERALALNPNSAPTRLNLALQLNVTGRTQESEAMLRDAVARDPFDSHALVELAAFLRGNGPSDEIVDLFARAAQIDPNDVGLAVAHGEQAHDMDRFIESEQAFRRALELNPRVEMAALGLADLLEGLNRENELPDLITAGRSAGLNASALAYIEALDCRRTGNYAQGLEELERIQGVVERPRFEHLRGQFLDRTGCFGPAFDAFQEMNRSFRADPSNPDNRAAAYRGIVRTEAAKTTPEWFTSWRPETTPYLGACPAFLIGFPRSGTTLLDTILLGHPAVEILEEEPALSQAHECLGGFDEIAAASDELLTAARAKYWEIAAKRTELRSGTLLIDKNPLHMNKLPIINRLFPHAPIILAVRHPCDVVLSCFITYFALNPGMANFLTMETTAELYDLSFDYAVRAIDVMSLRSHIVVYENIVVDRERELRSLFNFLELSWDAAVLDHQSIARAREHIKTASYAQVVEPIYTRAAGRWQSYRKHLEPVLPILRPWIERFGYSA